jgi:dolichyl-phosphate-mannose--protein O-mannosyl transferase
MIFSLLVSAAKSTEKELSVPVVYYSIVKLQHNATDFLLSSIELNYQTGSTQQLVRGVNESKIALAETYWTLLPAEKVLESGAKEKHQGEPVKCGDKIILRHTVTSKTLHSHAITAQLGQGYEVSAFDGKDTGDIWTVECDHEKGAIFVKDIFKLHHQDTGYYLNANKTGKYIKEIMGEHEIYCSESSDDAEWIVRHGIFVK